jgi:hypothetical protein
MRLARDTRQTLGLAIEALLELLDAIGPDPEAEPSLAVPEQVNQSRAWAHPGNRQELEEQCEDEGAIEQDCIPGSEDELPRALRFDQAQVVAANKQAQTALQALLRRLRRQQKASSSGGRVSGFLENS